MRFGEETTGSTDARAETSGRFREGAAGVRHGAGGRAAAVAFDTDGVTRAAVTSWVTLTRLLDVRSTNWVVEMVVSRCCTHSQLL